MKKLFKCACSVVLLLLLFAVIVFAHSGKTDSNGGHFDHSTGSYHYHHGYSAHSHYDMNGDGKLDCPYNFNDKTSHNSGSTNKPSYGSSSNNISQTKQTSIKDIVVTIFIIIGISLFALLFGYSSTILQALHSLLMIPIKSLIKKHCQEDLQEKVRDKIGIIVMVFLNVAVVVLVTTIVILVRHN